MKNAGVLLISLCFAIQAFAVNSTPDGIVTTLPIKNGPLVEALPIGTVSNEGKAVVQAENQTIGVHTSLDLRSESPANYKIAEISPRIMLDLGNQVTLGGQGTFYSFNPTGGNSPFLSIGRPEVVSTVTYYKSERWKLTGGLAVDLPFYSANNSGISLAPMNVWGFEPSESWDLTWLDGKTHFLGNAKLIYDLNNSGSNVSLSRPLSAASSVRLSHQWGSLTVGMAFHTLNWLGGGTLSVAGVGSTSVVPLN